LLPAIVHLHRVVVSNVPHVATLKHARGLPG
jgi:hypothetical protein